MRLSRNDNMRCNLLRIEFIGIPGSGKTTLCTELLSRLNHGGDTRYITAEEAFHKVAKTNIDRIFRYPLKYLPNQLSRKLAAKLVNRSIMQFEAQNKFLAENGKALSAFFSSSIYRDMSITDRGLVIGNLLETASLCTSIHDVLADKFAVFFGEGLVQKSFMFVGHNSDLSNEEEKSRLHDYLANIPLPSLTIYVQANVSTCKERMLNRPEGLPLRLKGADTNTIGSFLENANTHLETVTAWLEDNHASHVIRVNNQQPLELSITEALSALQQAGAVKNIDA